MSRHGQILTGSVSLDICPCLGAEADASGLFNYCNVKHTNKQKNWCYCYTWQEFGEGQLILIVILPPSVKEQILH